MDRIVQLIGGPRVGAAIVGVGVLLAVWGFARFGAAPVWVPVVSGAPLELVSQATQRLDEEGIPYRLDRGGSVVAVEEDAVARARVVLAADGIGGNAARPGFEIFDRPSWGMTDFTQHVNYRRALEGELERTIGRMHGVRAAQVHLAIQESSWLRAGARPNEASVVLQLNAAGHADDPMVEGVQFLVANAVEGLAPENVMVLDDRGRLLSAPDGERGVGLSSRQLQVQRQVETYLQAKAEALVEQMVGPGNVTVRVAAELDFDQVDRTVQSVDPEQQVMLSEDRSEIVPGTAEQGASSVSSNTQYEAARSTETVSRGGARLQRLTVAVVLADRKSEAEDGAVTWEPRGESEIRSLEAVVRNAVGFSAERGDAISVVSAPPEALPVPEPESAPGAVAVVQTIQRPLVAILGLAVTLFIALRLLSSLQAGAVVRGLAAGTGHAALGAGSVAGQFPASTSSSAMLASPHPAAPRVADPQMTARVVRAWMKD